MNFDMMTMFVIALILLICGSFGINTYQKCKERGDNMDVNRNFFIVVLVVASLLLLGAGVLWWRASPRTLSLGRR